jgi:hypothetical protein
MKTSRVDVGVDVVGLLAGALTGDFTTFTPPIDPFTSSGGAS